MKMKARSSIVFFLLSILFAPLLYSQNPIALTGGTLVDVRTGETIENSIILIDGDRIADVGAVDKIQMPSSARRIDASGKWIVPGLMDMRAHVSHEPDLPFEMYLAKGVTTIRDPGSDVTLSRLLRMELDSGKRIGPRYFFAGPLLDGIPPVWPGGSILVDTPERAVSAVNFLIDQGVDFVKVYNNVQERELIEIIKTAHARGVRVAGHVPRTITMTRAVELGMDCLEHVRITARELLSPEEADKLDFLPYGTREVLLWQSFDLNSEKMQKLISFLGDKKVFMDVTLIADYGLVIDPADEIKDPNNHFLPEEVFEAWKSYPQPEVYKVPLEVKRASAASFEKRMKFVGLCFQAGVRIITGTDGAGLGNLLPGFALHRELKMLSDAGMNPLDILRATTITSAEALGKEKDLGSIEKGKLADLLILEKDPLSDIKNLDSIVLVFKGGRDFKPDDLLKKKEVQH